MSIRWIWGFESGADETYYSGSGWNRCFVSPHPSGTYEQTGYFSDTRNQVDFSSNFPHQPPNKAGGGQFSLKVEPGTILGFNDGQATWQSFQVLSPSVWKEGEVPDTGTLSFSIYNNLDTTQWPVSGAGSSAPAEQFGMVQRFLSLYPSDIEVTQANSGSFGQFLSVMTGSILPEVPPMLQLFMVRSDNVTGSTNPVYDGIFAYCIVGTGPTLGVAPWGAAYDYLTAATIPGFSFVNAITGALAAGASGYGSSPDFGGFGYTGSEGIVLTPDDWSKVAVEYSPHPSNGSLKVSVNGTDIIDVSGVPTGYTASVDLGGAPGNKRYDNQKWGRIGFTSHGFLGNPNPWYFDTSSTLEPATFWYDHLCVYDNATTDDWSFATASVFIDRFVPRADISTGSYIGGDSGTVDLYDYVDDTNYFLNNSFLRVESNASDSEIRFSSTAIFQTKAGHLSWSVGDISHIIGLNSINAVSSSTSLGLYGSSLLWDAGFSNTKITGPFTLIDGKKFIESVSGTTGIGTSWNYLTGNTGVGPGSGILHAGFTFGEAPEDYTVTISGGSLRFDTFPGEITMFIKESGSGNTIITWPGGAVLNDPVTWTWSTAEASTDFVNGNTYYLDVRESFGDAFFDGSSSSSLDFTIENNEISSGFTDSVPTNVGQLFLDGYGSGNPGEAARFYFIYNGTGSAPTNPTPGTSGERYNT